MRPEVSPKIRNDQHWFSLRDRARRRGRNLCEFCRLRPIYALHHRTYDRHGCEKLTDVMAVCGRCHDLIHGFVNEIRVEQGSLAHRGDTGFGLTPLWLSYLQPPEPHPCENPR